MTTLCGRLPVYSNLILSPLWMVSVLRVFELRVNRVPGPTLTVLVVARAGTAIAAATTARAARTAMRGFMCNNSSRVRWRMSSARQACGDRRSFGVKRRSCVRPATAGGRAGARSEHGRLAVVAPHVLQRGDDLALRAVRPRGVEQTRHEILVRPGRRLADACE